jgi:hypothetical protein
MTVAHLVEKQRGAVYFRPPRRFDRSVPREGPLQMLEQAGVEPVFGQRGAPRR